MAKTVSDVSIRRREVRVSLDWLDLKSLLSHAAIKAAGLDGIDNAGDIDVQIRVEQETEGSPSYNVKRWRAMVDLTVPLPGSDAQPPTI